MRDIAFLTTIAASISLASLSHAQNFTWNGATGNWNDPTQWLNGIIPSSAPTDQIIFPTGDYTSTVTADHDPWIVNGITFTGNTVTINNTNSAGIQFDGSSPYIIELGTGSDHAIINSPVILAQTLTYAPTSGVTGVAPNGAALTFNGPVSGPGGLIIQSSNVTLNSANSFGGGVTVQGTNPFPGTQLLVQTPQSLGTGPLTLNGTTGLTTALFFASSSTAFNNDISVNGPTNQLFTYTNFGTTPTGYVTFGHLTFQSDNSSLIVGSSFSFIIGPSTLAFQGITLGGNSTIHNQNSLGITLTPGAISETGGSRSLTIAEGITLNLNTASTYSGGTFMTQNLTLGAGIPAINANIAGAFGSGPVLLSAGNLSLNATSAANNSVSASSLSTTINYNANGAAGGHLVTAGTLAFSTAVTSFSTGTAADTFATLPSGVVAGSGAILAQLDRNTNFTPGFATTLQNNDGGLPTSLNLGANADLLIGLAKNFASNLTLGTGTPWLGVAGGGVNGASISYNGVLTVRSNLILQALTLGSATANSFSILPDTGISPVVATLRNDTLQLPLANYSGVSKFVVDTGTLILPIPNALGGGSGTTPVPLDVSGNLTVSDSAALNANVTFHAGSNLTIKAPGLTGTGLLTRDTQPMTINLSDANALTGSQFSAAFVQAGDAVLLTAGNIVGLKNVNPAANFTIPDGLNFVQQVDGLNLNGGSLFLGEFDTSFVPGPSAQGDSTIRVGLLGATFAGGGFYQQGGGGGDSAIEVPIIAQGSATFGFPGATSTSFQSGAIVLTNTANQFNAVTVNNIVLEASSPAAITGANITLNGGLLALLSATRSFSPPTLFNNTITIAQSAIIADNFSGVTSIFPAPSANNAIALTTVNLSNAILSLRLTYPGFVINTLNLTGNGTIDGTGNIVPIINAITQSGTSPLALTLNKVDFRNIGAGYLVTGPVSVTGPITIGTGATVEFDGTISPSTSPLTVGIRGTLTGTGVIHRPVVYSSASTFSQFLATRHRVLNVTGSSFTTSPGTLTLDSLSLSPSTLLLINFHTPNVIGGPTNDLIVIAGDLTLDGSLASAPGGGPGTYTLFTYGGSLTDNGLNLPTLPGDSLALDLSTPGEVNLIVTATPEPASLTLAVPAALLFLRRKRTTF